MIRNMGMKREIKILAEFNNSEYDLFIRNAVKIYLQS